MHPIFIERLPKYIPKVKPQMFRIPIACNAFTVFGNATGDSVSGKKAHYFGRDFMFPTAEAFEDTACHIMYNPDPEDGRLPLLSMSARGFAGSVMAMNCERIAMGLTSPLPETATITGRLLTHYCWWVIRFTAARARNKRSITRSNSAWRCLGLCHCRWQKRSNRGHRSRDAYPHHGFCILSA